MRSILFAMAIAALALSACGASSGTNVAEGAGGDVAVEDAPAAGADADDASGADDVSDTTTSVPPTTIPNVEPILGGVEPLFTLTPTEVDTLRPTLAWEPTAEAATYYLVVLDEAGEPYWVWSGEETEAFVGGADFGETGNGPIIGADYSWSVTAFDADGVLVGASGQVPISSSGS